MSGLLWATVLGAALVLAARHLIRHHLWTGWHWWRHGRLPPPILRRLTEQARRSGRLRQMLDDRNAILDQLSRRERSRWTRAIDGAVRSAFELESRLHQVRTALATVQGSKDGHPLPEAEHPQRVQAEQRWAAYRAQVEQMHELARQWEWQLQSVALELRSIRLASVVQPESDWPPKSLLQLEELTLEMGARVDLELPPST